VVTNLTKKVKVKTVLYIDSDLAMVDDVTAVVDSMGLKMVHASTIERAKLIIGQQVPHLIISEIDLPDGDGISLCQELRKMKELGRVGLVLISEKTDSYIQVLGFEAGADDYLVKPINKRLTQARLQALLRRSDVNFGVAKTNELQINRETFLIEHKGKEISLPRKEFEILALLIQNKGKVFNRDKIKEEIWLNKGAGVNSRTVDVHIKNIRETIGAKFIKTIKGVGYKFVG